MLANAEFNKMPGTTNPKIRAKNQAYQSNVNHRGNVKASLRKDKDYKYPVGYATLGVFIFVVIGSAIFEMLKFV